MKKKIMIGVVIAGIVICLLGMALIKNYVDKTPKLTVKETGNVEENSKEHGSPVINTTSFSLSVPACYKLQEEESSENEKYFDRENPGAVLCVYDATAGNADLEANTEFYQSMLAESYGISDSEIKAMPSPITGHDQCYYLTWEYKKDGHSYTAVSYIIYEEGTVLVLTETGDSLDEESMKEELLEIAQTVNYTGDYHLPDKEEYPFSVENAFVCITVPEGFDSPQAADVRGGNRSMESTDDVGEQGQSSGSADDGKEAGQSSGNADDGKEAGQSSGNADDGKGAGQSSDNSDDVKKEIPNHYTTDSEMIVVRYAAADNYDKGLISKFAIEYLDDQETQISDQAEKEYQRLQSGDVAEVLPLEETKMGEIWPELSDTSLSGMTAYKIKVCSREANYSTDKYYVEINHNKFCINISYPFENDDAMDEMYQLFDEMSPVFKEK